MLILGLLSDPLLIGFAMMRVTWIILIGLISASAVADEYPQRDQDETIVQTVLRLENFDLSSSEKGKTAVLRYLKHNVGSESFFQLLRKYELPEADELLLQLAAEQPNETAGVEAARMLVEAGKQGLLKEAIDHNDQAAANLVTVLGLTGRPEAFELVAPLVTETKRPLAVRSAAAKALARAKNGHRRLADLVVAGELPEDLNFTVGNLLRSSPDERIQAMAHKHLPPPATADAKPLPPLTELTKRHGDADRGQKVFHGKGTCAKCHKVKGEGKEVGPDLSEIGSKLSREAMLVAILDPSAGISHNFETYQVFLANGTVFSGLKISETDDAVTLKSGEGIVRTIPREEIDELVKQKVSLMPADLQRLMTADELVDVVAYLSTLKKQAE